MYDSEKKACNWEKYIACHIKYHIIIGNLMECEYKELDPWSKVHYLLIGIRCEKLFTAVAIVILHQHKYEKDFDAVISFLSE